MGIKLKYVDPLPIDEVAADFPDLTIICAHPAWPWTDVSIAMAVHKANVYIDLSGWSPKYLPPQLLQEVNTRLKNKALFGTDYPFINPDRWLDDFAKIELKPGVREKIMLENAKKVLGLE
jgi:predicted TIM-barrel fold metal-dependent hydrolase